MGVEEEGLDNEPDFKKPSDKTLVMGILILVLLFVGAFVFFYFTKEEPLTVEGLHSANFDDELDPESGRIFQGYSFINIDGFWYTQLKSPAGSKNYDMALRFAPWEVENIPLTGQLNESFFNTETQYFVTFDPLGSDFNYVALAIGDFNEHLMKIFEKVPVAACDKNETDACFGRPIINCDSKGLVIYVKESADVGVGYANNCIVLSGSGLDLVRAADRSLYNLYGILGK